MKGRSHKIYVLIVYGGIAVMGDCSVCVGGGQWCPAVSMTTVLISSDSSNPCASFFKI